MRVKFRVFGLPKTAGSKKSFATKHGKVVTVDSSGKAGDNWRIQVQAAAQAVYDGPLLDGPLAASMCFYFHRPKSHYRTGKNAHLLKDSAPVYHTQKPDVIKLARAVEDALAGIVILDDKLIVKYNRLVKRYVCRYKKREGVDVVITKINM